jgi:lipoate synthase
MDTDVLYFHSNIGLQNYWVRVRVKQNVDTLTKNKALTGNDRLAPVCGLNSCPVMEIQLWNAFFSYVCVSRIEL